MVTPWKHIWSEILSFLHRWQNCWKCESDTDVKIENHLTMMKNNYFFIKKVHIKTQSNEKDVLVIFVLLQETNFNLFDKKCTRENVKCHPYSTWKKLTWMNCNWTGRLQVTLLSTWHLYFLKEIVLAHFHSLFKGSNLDAFWENKGKIHERGCVKEFFP